MHRKRRYRNDRPLVNKPYSTYLTDRQKLCLKLLASIHRRRETEEVRTAIDAHIAACQEEINAAIAKRRQ